MTADNTVALHPRALSRRGTEPGNDELAAQAELEAVAHAIAIVGDDDAADVATSQIEIVSADDLVEAEEEACA